MRRSARGRRLTITFSITTALAVVPLGVMACGDDDATTAQAAKQASPTALAITTSDAGPDRFRTTAPKSIKGGLVQLAFTNAGQDPHESQLVRIDGGHTPREALAILTAERATKIPAWLHLAGGAGGTGPKQKLTTTLNLPAGRYATLDLGGGQEGPSPSARGAIAAFRITPGLRGTLPASTATITARDHESEPEHSFKVSGLKVGHNRLRFKNTGKEPHHAVMFPILPGRSLADVEKAFGPNAPAGPPPVDFAKGASTAVLDGKTEEVTDLQLRVRGKYALVCFISDRDAKGKPHLQEGMLKEINVG